MYIKNIDDFLRGIPKRNKNGLTARKARIYNHYLLRLITLAQSSINWLNLPLDIPEIVIEESLIYHCNSVFFQDDVTGIYSILPCTIDGELNRYGLPRSVMAYGKNGFQYKVDVENKKGVLIYDNYARKPIIESLSMFAKRITDILITTDVNLQQQRVPLVYKTTQQGKANIDQALEAQDSGAYCVVVDNTLEEDIAAPLYTNVPYIADKLQIELEKIWAEALTFIGIVNVDEKAERLNSFEVGSQLEEVVSQLNTRLKPRKEACEKINEYFGLDLDVIPASWVLTRDRSQVVNEEAPEPENEPREVLINGID